MSSLLMEGVIFCVELVTLEVEVNVAGWWNGVV
jgi:hypothetical protein